MNRLIIHAVPIALVAVGAPSGNARAQALPAWQIADICAKESAPGQCAAFEGQALNVVSSSWAFVVDATKQSCLAQLASPLDHSWRLLAECIDAEAFKVRDLSAVKTAKTPAEPVPPLRPPGPAAATSPASTSPVETPKQQ
ncbi:MAG: hypothetical protein AB7O44_32530 [Hyphomicrobiaceae bacterium]